MKYFVISDIHGEFDLFEQLLSYWKKEEEQLIILGDLADRGPKSKQVIKKVMSLVKNEGAICLLGNHEDIFLRWLADPIENLEWYYRNGGQATIESLLYKGVVEEEGPLEAASAIKNRYPEMITFFEQLPLFYETDAFIFVHAGINLLLDDWQQTLKRDFLWIREEFHRGHNQTGKTVVFGHTSVNALHDNVYNVTPWIHDHKIGIDGGAAYEGALNGVVLENGKIIQLHQVYHPNKKWGYFDETSK